MRVQSRQSRRSRQSRPNCPYSLLPQAYRVCVEERARTWLEPHAIWIICIILYKLVCLYIIFL